MDPIRGNAPSVSEQRWSNGSEARSPMSMHHVNAVVTVARRSCRSPYAAIDSIRDRNRAFCAHWEILNIVPSIGSDFFSSLSLFRQFDLTENFRRWLKRKRLQRRSFDAPRVDTVYLNVLMLGTLLALRFIWSPLPSVDLFFFNPRQV